MGYKLIGGLIVISLFAVLVIGADTPPPLPTEYWGRLMINGTPAADGTIVSYWNGQQWTNTTTLDGWYNIILTGGDSDLTFNDDPTCITHWGGGQACIPCVQNVNCTEGPRDGDLVNLSVNNYLVSVIWGSDSSGVENIIASIQLYAGWNMISPPFKLLVDNIPNATALLNGTKLVDYYDTPTKTWKRYNSGTPPFTWTLFKMEPNKGYWVRVDSNQRWSIIGTSLNPNAVNLVAGWNLAGFQLYNNTVQNATAQLSGTKLVDYYNTPTKTWKRYNSGTPPFTWTLNEINVAKGYWVRVDSNQTWVEP